MVDGVLLLVDASRGAAAADALRAAQGARGAAARDPRHQQGRPARRARRRGRRRGLRPVPRPRRRRGPDRVPDRLHERARRPGRRWRPTRRGDDLAPLFDLLVERIPPPQLRPRAPAAGARHQPRRVALRRPARALPRPQRHDRARASRSPGAAPTARSRARTVAELYVTEALDRVEAERPARARSSPSPASPEVTIGETLADPDDPRPLPVITVDEPSLVGHDRHQHVAARRPRGRQAHRAPGAGPARRRSSSATSRSACCPPSARTPGRSRAAASSSSRCSSS